jgi:hypothetical protein
LALGVALVGCYRGAQADGGDGGSADDGSAGDADDDAGDASDGGDDGPTEDCAGVAAGFAPMRRLTQVQYRNTILDLFGGAVDPGTTFPAPQIHDEYTNNPAANVVSLAAAQDILESAEAIAVQVIDDVDAIVACDGAQDHACAEVFVDDFGPRAFRRPLTAEERTALLAIHDDVAAIDGFADGIGTVVATVLQSPQFLYLVEEGGDEIEPGVFRLTDFEIATRLSYLLWDSMPDDALFAAAAAGELQDDDGIAAQVDRMLAVTDKSGPALERFVREWTRYDGVPTYDKDATVFPTFDAELTASMDEELSRYVRGVLQGESPTLRRLLTSTTTEVDARMAAFFGVAAPAQGWAQVDTADGRVGLLGRPALLAEHSTAASTAPIFRGRLVRTQFLCDEIPPPPPDAMAKAPEYPPDATERERTAILIGHLDCGGCHGLMNPIGLGFEPFDAIGALRTTDVDGSPVDDLGDVLAGPPGVGGEFHGIAELADKMSGSDDVAACFVDQFYRFSFGLQDGEVLECAIDPVAEAFVEGGADIHDLVMQLALSGAFRTRIVVEE